MTTKYVTTSELAAHFNVSSATIMAMMKSGEIPAGTFMRLGRVFRFDLEKIEEALLTRAGTPEEAGTSTDPAQSGFDFNDEADEDGTFYN